MKKQLLILVAFTTTFIILVGCSSSGSNDDENFFSESIRKAGDKLTGFFGEPSLTKDKSLEGERVFGEDDYTGTYEAVYQHFSGTENLFGGASLDGSEGKVIQITYNGNIESGEAEVFWNTADSEKKLLFEGHGEHTETISLQGGWEYLSLEGDELEADIRVKIE
ncbi:hypothetical protein [Oceanobacillus oncorhynchi]|uniref:Lipoprotein n=1 Tax=Oceanobacillus oncorhynchi TaxID=545501 RepID=A0A0A1ME93_9BACI|nr:hypothetical protein [Oceanobacillus oncorhynchi]UUI38042.1 hypothetical protein NP440_11775 [Oceanobacillus oncorhynchi]CEI83690.1 hypothetical protein BN997_03608 [Oceanobacillus oncorhynchi]